MMHSIAFANPSSSSASTLEVRLAIDNHQAIQQAGSSVLSVVQVQPANQQLKNNRNVQASVYHQAVHLDRTSRRRVMRIKQPKSLFCCLMQIDDSSRLSIKAHRMLMHSCPPQSSHPFPSNWLMFLIECLIGVN